MSETDEIIPNFAIMKRTMAAAKKESLSEEPAKDDLNLRKQMIQNIIA